MILHLDFGLSFPLSLSLIFLLDNRYCETIFDYIILYLCYMCVRVCVRARTRAFPLLRCYTFVLRWLIVKFETCARNISDFTESVVQKQISTHTTEENEYLFVFFSFTPSSPREFHQTNFISPCDISEFSRYIPIIVSQFVKIENCHTDLAQRFYIRKIKRDNTFVTNFFFNQNSTICLRVYVRYRY